MTRSMATRLMRALSGIAIAAAVALSPAAPASAWDEIPPDISTDTIDVTVPTEIPCTLMADGTVVAPSGLRITDRSDTDVILDAYTADSHGHAVDFTLDVDGQRALTRKDGKDTAPAGGVPIDRLSGGSDLKLNVSKLTRQSDSSLIDAAANGPTAMFTLGFSFRFKEPEAFAVFSADDGSLSFYKRIRVPKPGESFDGRAVTEVYTGVEEDSYSLDTLPWKAKCPLITSARVVDQISPASTAYWFYNCSNLTSCDLAALDTSGSGRMFGMFHGCSKLTTLDVSNFATGKVSSMGNMFSKCSSLTSLNLSGWDTSNVTDMVNMFSGCSSLSSLDLSGFATGKVVNMGHMFANCSKLTALDVSGLDTSGATTMQGMFSSCSKLTSLDVSRFATGKVTNMNGMFSNCSSLEALDLSGFDTSSVTDAGGMFLMCNKLQQVDLGEKFAWVGTNGYLPTPFSFYIPSADGMWYDTEGVGYAPDKVPGGKAMTYYASKDLVPKREAFAVYSADDGSLNFYKRDLAPKVGDTFEGKTVTEVYTGIETGAISKQMQTRAPDPGVSSPFVGHSGSIISVTVVDTISPLNMTSWFSDFEQCKTFDLHRLDTSKVTDMTDMFYGCSAVTDLDLSNFDTSNCGSMRQMFPGCIELKSLDISSFDTTGVITYGMFVAGAHEQFQVNKLESIKIGTQFNAVSELPNQSSQYIPGADGKWYAASDGKGYNPADIPSNKADTYYASKSLLPKPAEKVDILGSVELGQTLSAVVTGAQPDAELAYRWYRYKPESTEILARDIHVAGSDVYKGGQFTVSEPGGTLSLDPSYTGDYNGRLRVYSDGNVVAEASWGLSGSDFQPIELEPGSYTFDIYTRKNLDGPLYIPEVTLTNNSLKEEIVGASSSTYTTTQEDLKSQIFCLVYDKRGVYTGALTSDPTGKIDII